MEQNEHIEEIEETTPEAKQHTSTSSVVMATLVVALLGGAMVWLRHDLGVTLERTQQAQQEALLAIEKRLDTLESKTTELSERPNADSTNLETVTTSLSDIQKTLTLLAERVDTLEKSPEPLAQPSATTTPLVGSPAATATPAAEITPTSMALPNLKVAILSGSPYQAELDIWYKEHPKAKPYPTLRQYAEKGIPTEVGLRQQLKMILSQPVTPATVAPADKGMIARINQNFSQFVTIKKKGETAPEVDALKEKIDTLSLPQLMSEVNQLPIAAQPAVTDWLAQIKARADALSELVQLESAA